MASAPERRARRGDATGGAARPDARRRAGPAEGARGERQLPRRAALPRPVPGPPAAAVHSRRGDLRRRTEDGRRVIANPALPYGGFAEYAVADAAALLPAPDALDDAEAAALHIGYQTGWFGLHRRARLQAGETCWCTPRPAGSAAPPSSSARPPAPRVIGVVGGQEKAHVARDARLRPRHRPAHARTSSPRCKEATGGRGADVIYDPVGGDAYAQSAKVRRLRGPDRRRRLRERHHPQPRPQPRPGEELRDPRPALGPVHHQGPEAASRHCHERTHRARRAGRDQAAGQRAGPAGRRGRRRPAGRRRRHHRPRRRRCPAHGAERAA